LPLISVHASTERVTDVMDVLCAILAPADEALQRSTGKNHSAFFRSSKSFVVDWDERNNMAMQLQMDHDEAMNELLRSLEATSAPEMAALVISVTDNAILTSFRSNVTK